MLLTWYVILADDMGIAEDGPEIADLPTAGTIYIMACYVLLF